MTFKEQLKIASNNNLSILDLDVANECDCIFNFNYTDNEFEALCACVKRAYLESDIKTIESVVKLIQGLVVEDNWTIQEICDMPISDLLVEINYRQ